MILVREKIPRKAIIIFFHNTILKTLREALAQYVGFGLHLLTGTVAGNIYGQASIFWRRMAPNSYRRGIMTGLIVGIALWVILFVPLGTFSIQSKILLQRQHLTNTSTKFRIILKGCIL